MSDGFQGDPFLIEQRGDGVSQQFFKQLGVLATEVTERMVVGRDSATDPHGVEIAGGQVINPAGTADSFQRGVEPQRKENPRIDRVASGLALGGFDPLVKRRQIE